MAQKKGEEPIKAYMGEDTTFSGTLNFEGIVRIDGKFEGEVVTNDVLIVGETGELSADITAGIVVCKGQITGSIVAAEKVEMHANSRIAGNIKSPALHVELGATLDGYCDMSGKEPKIVKLKKVDEKDVPNVTKA